MQKYPKVDRAIECRKNLDARYNKENLIKWRVAMERLEHEELCEYYSRLERSTKQ